MDVDTSSYKQPEGKSALEQAAEFGNLHRQGQMIQIGDQIINKNKLDQANQALSYLTRALTAIGPEGTKEQFLKAGMDTAKQFNIPPAMQKVWIDKIQTAPDSKTFYNEAVTQLANHGEMVNYHLGQPATQSNQQSTLSGVVTPKTGGAFVPRTVTPQLIPPTAPTVDSDSGQPRMMGTTTPPVQPVLPVGPMPSAGITGPSRNFGGTVLGATVEPPSPTMSLPVQRPVGPTTAPTPMFEEGKRALTEDQALATQKLTAIKPALQALPLLKDIMAGPGTDKFTKAVAALKAFGILSTSANDPIAIRQEVSKKLAQYVSSNPVGQRSDAAQTLAEASSPNPGQQILPALEKLTKDSIILDRVQAMRSGAFQGQDYSKYGQHRSTFPAKFDERAAGLDLMEPKERQTLLDDMKKKQNTTEGKKFWQSLAEVKRQGIFSTGE